eukprot:1147105-Pelagomonas_calceolata.AAC.3
MAAREHGEGGSDESRGWKQGRWARGNKDGKGARRPCVINAQSCKSCSDKEAYNSALRGKVHICSGLMTWKGQSKRQECAGCAEHAEYAGLQAVMGCCAAKDGTYERTIT